jgi:hypothetical protein
MADRLAKANRVSIRAVLVPRGQDATKALAENGILEPVAVPFLFADAAFASASHLGDGRTPNLIATLEPDETGSSDASKEGSQPASGTAEDDDRGAAAEPPRRSMTSATSGARPLAPIPKPSL